MARPAAQPGSRRRGSVARRGRDRAAGVALFSGGGEEAQQIAIGSIIGAPFLLGTLAMLLIAGASHSFKAHRSTGRQLDVDPIPAKRDLVAFLIFFPVAILLGIGTPFWLRCIGAVVLLLGYAAYVVRTAKQDQGAGDEAELRPLYFDTSKGDPPSTLQIVLQLLVALAAIILGTKIFVGEVEAVAESLGVTSLVLSLILAPLATELPEKINSVIWVREGKDGLALGNVTGAMSFQASIPVTIGLLFTPWDLDPFALTAAVLALAGGILAYIAIGRRDFGPGFALAWTALFVAFLGYVIVGS